jgi:translation initiation factor IF-1
MTDQDAIRGKVIAALPSVTFMVEMTDGRMVRAKLAGKMIRNQIRVVPGDQVTVVLSPDGAIGRINRRL